MDFDNNEEKNYCADDDTWRIYCDICDKLCVDRYYNNHLTSGTHINNINKRQRLSNLNMKIQHETFCFKHKCMR